MKTLPAFTFLLFLLFFTSIVEAGNSITLNPDSGHSNQNQINAALEKGHVFLGPGVYEVDGPILIQSNRVLSGDQNAIVRVYSGSSKWFTGSVGIISSSGVINNVEISGFQIDGNIGNLPSSYADSRSDTDHDCERCILFRGASNQFASNIKVHDMKLYNSFSDGFYIIFGENVQCYNNFISNCQHEGVYYSCLKNSILYSNKIAGITSDCARLDCCVNCKVYDNIFFSYNGESYGAYKGGQAGLQIANTGSSHGYDGSNKPQKTDNVEVTNNTFADPGRQAIWLHNYDGNVFVHQNHFIDAAGLETQGIPVGDISSNVGAISGKISTNNPPSVETSEKVFTSILDFLQQDYVFQYPTVKHDFRASATVTDVNESVRQYSTVRVTGKDLRVIKFEYNGTTTKHFTEQDMWTGELPHLGDDLYISGHYQPEKMKITVYGQEGYQNVENVQTKKVTSAGIGINPDFFIFIAVLAICGISIARNLRRII